MSKKTIKIITIPLHIGDFLSGTMHMDTLEKGAYIMLLLSHYQIGVKGLQDNDKFLARITGLTPRQWTKIKPVLKEKFIVKNGFWVNVKCKEVLQNIYRISTNNKAKALKQHNSGDAVAQPQQSRSSANQSQSLKPKPKPKNKYINISKELYPEYEKAKELERNEDMEFYYKGDVVKLTTDMFFRWMNKFNMSSTELYNEVDSYDGWITEQESTSNWFRRLQNKLDNKQEQKP